VSWKIKLLGKTIVGISKWMPSIYKRYSLKHTKSKQEQVESVLTKPLKNSRVALITSAGVHLKSDKPFHVMGSGDYTYRTIPSNTNVEDLEVTHLYYDTKHAKADKTIVFPLPQLQHLVAENVIGSLSNVNIGLNGGTLKKEPHEKETAPKVVKELINDNVDIALLVPG
jgi:D-proline reductase (dithiol) PrdB